jgi:hypothetical protein
MHAGELIDTCFLLAEYQPSPAGAVAEQEPPVVEETIAENDKRPADPAGVTA